MQAVRLPESEFPRPAPAGPNRAAPSFGAPVRPSDASDDDIEELGTVAAPFAGAAAGPVLASLLIRAGDGRVLDVYPMTPQGVAVGRSRRSGNEIVLRDDPLVSKRHARIVHDGRTFVAYDQGSTNGTFVNGAPLEPGVGRPLEFGDEVQVGETVLALRPAGQDPRAASAPAAPGWRLVAGDGESIPLSGTMGVGAAGSNQLVVHSPGVAGNHARITVQGSDVLVEDLNSPGGTYINGERIPPLFPIALFEGHQVTFGQAMFRLIRGVGTAGAR